MLTPSTSLVLGRFCLESVRWACIRSYAIAQFVLCMISAVIALFVFRTRPAAAEKATNAPTYGSGGSINPSTSVRTLDDR
jgi:hypothetical protein